MGAESVAPPGLAKFCALDSWGSRPRLIIFRRSAALDARPKIARQPDIRWPAGWSARGAHR